MVYDYRTGAVTVVMVVAEVVGAGGGIVFEALVACSSSSGRWLVSRRSVGQSCCVFVRVGAAAAVV